MDVTSTDTDSIRPRKTHRLRALIIVLLVVAGLVAITPLVAAPFVRDKIESMVSDHLHGNLAIGSLSYSFPYGVHVADAAFTTDAAHGSVKVLSVKSIDLSLRQLPFRHGPIVVERLRINEPVVHVIRQPDGTIFGYDIPKRGKEAPSGDRQIKLSDILQLRKFDLVRASVVIEDQMHPEELPLEWRDIDAHLNLSPKSKSSYGFAFTADNQPIARVDLEGTADIDALTVQVEKLSVNAQVKRDDRSSPLPAKLQTILRTFGVEGAIQLVASGDLPGKNPAAGRFNATLTVSDVRLKPTSQPWALDRVRFTLKASKRGDKPATMESSTAPRSSQSTQPTDTPHSDTPHSDTPHSDTPHSDTPRSDTPRSDTPRSDTPRSDTPPVEIWLTDFTADGMGGDLSIPQATATIDPIAKTWSLNRIEGKLSSMPGSATSPATTNVATLEATTESATEPTTEPKEPTTKPRAVPSLSKYFLAGSADFSGGGNGSFATTQQAIHSPTGQFVLNLNELKVRPPGFPQPVENINGDVRFVDRALLLENVSASIGPDLFSLTQALISLDDLPTRVQMRDIVARATLQQPGAAYPDPLDQLAHQLQPAGTFDLRGSAGVYLARGKIEPDYALHIFPKEASASLTDRRIPIEKLRGQIDIAPKAVAAQLDGALFGGAMSFNATALPASPFSYNAELRLTDVDLAQASQTLNLLKPDGKPKLSGQARTHVHLNGDVSNNDVLAGVKGHGWVRVRDGDLWSLQLFSSIVDKLSIAKNAVTAGDAAAVFDVKEKNVAFKKLAVSSTALGVQGSGNVGFNGDLDLQVVVAPLGDWRQRVKEFNIPLFSSVAGDFVGAMQKVVNTATSNLLYQFRVTGNAQKPQLSAIPAPILTEGVAKVFGTMLKGGKSDTIGEDIGAKDE